MGLTPNAKQVLVSLKSDSLVWIGLLVFAIAKYELTNVPELSEANRVGGDYSVIRQRGNYFLFLSFFVSFAEKFNRCLHLGPHQLLLQRLALYRGLGMAEIADCLRTKDIGTIYL